MLYVLTCIPGNIAHSGNNSWSNIVYAQMVDDFFARLRSFGVSFMENRTEAVRAVFALVMYYVQEGIVEKQGIVVKLVDGLCILR